ncbi:MAG: carboxypeptidase-like regulatory domain-containing protein [Polyangiaceae bacterium]|jgi:hypothetical protein|nr:carboxypeptidase-like regulatory domain-containing protein [Polyangiaceae bacterium]
MRPFPPRAAIPVGAAAIAVAAALPIGCDTDPKPAAPAASASVAPHATHPDPATLQGVGSTMQRIKTVPMASAIPVPAASVEAAVNPGKLPAYNGPTGAIEGVIRMRGALPGDVSLALPPSCREAQAVYGKLFREGKGRTVADVLVAVTGYDAYVPAKSNAVRVEIRDCAFDRRTVAVTFGQRILAVNVDDKQSYIPVLEGEHAPAQLVATPGNDGVPLFPRQVGRYVLADGMNRRWMHAEVFVLKYATHAVTDIEGRYRIDQIPVGDVRVDALLPAINATAGKAVKVRAGAATRVDLALKYDEKAARAAAAPSSVPALGSSGGARPVPIAK